MSKTSEIKLKVHLDEQNMPDKMEWTSDEQPGVWHDSQGLIFSVWNAAEQNAMRIDLWTKEMRIDEMNYFVFQTIMTLADTYENATQNAELAKKMKGFGEYFAEKAEIFKDPNQHSNHQH
ncbi:MAG: gliding motility protein GldC [Bacteroidetes bacterium]|nr:gliding motility protein GldC [Bacteroidota bacterium]